MVHLVEGAQMSHELQPSGDSLAAATMRLPSVAPGGVPFEELRLRPSCPQYRSMVMISARVSGRVGPAFTSMLVSPRRPGSRRAQHPSRQ